MHEPLHISNARVALRNDMPLVADTSPYFAMAVLSELLGADAASAIVQALAGNELTPAMVACVLRRYDTMHTRMRFTGEYI